MNTLLGFVAPLLRSVAAPLLTVAGSALGTVKGGVETLAKMSDDNPKKSGSGVLAALLGLYGFDMGSVHDLGSMIQKLGSWIQGL